MGTFGLVIVRVHRAPVWKDRRARRSNGRTRPFVRTQRITAAWAEQKIAREIMVFLHSHGVGTARAVRIYNIYGADGVQVVTENPYQLARDI